MPISFSVPSLNTDGKIGDVLLNSQNIYEFISPRFLKDEIRKYHKKILLISGYSNAELLEIEDKVIQTYFIHFRSTHSPSQLGYLRHIWYNDIDPKDVAYIAFSKYFRCKLWSGDKRIEMVCLKKGFTNIINTEELYKLGN